jgi:hypothetical protein
MTVYATEKRLCKKDCCSGPAAPATEDRQSEGISCGSVFSSTSNLKGGVMRQPS